MRETGQLQSSSDYQEVGQQREKLLVSGGNFLVRVNGDIISYPAVVVYPEATPYALPRIFMLAAALTPAELASLAAFEEEQVSGFLAPRAKFYHRRHQNPDGSLCLLEQDNLDRDGVEVFDALTVLNRVRKWLTGLSTGHYPPESNEVELAAHYPKREAIQILLTDDFYRPNVASGQFYLQPIVKLEGQPPQHFIGACLVGRQASGLYLEEQEAPLRFMPDDLKTRANLTLRPDRLADELKKKELVEGYWWQLASEPPVFASPAELVAALGEGSEERGVQMIIETLWPQVKVGEPTIIFGLRFPNRRGELEWLMMTLRRVRQDKVLLFGPLPNVLDMLEDYELAALFSEPFTEQAFYLRNSGRVNQDTMRQQTVTLLGCGALGSEVADCLGKAGVANIWLNDMQEMHAHNTVRHLAGLRQLAMPKVLAVGGILLDHNRFLNLTLRGENVLRQPLNSYFAPVGIGISTMADDNTEGYVNEQAVALGRTVYYARALRGGKAARIFRVRPGRDACFDCLTLHKESNNPGFPVVPEDAELPTIRNECNNPVRPASAADLKLIAALTSRLILDELQAPTESETNHWVWTTEPALGLGATAVLPQALLARHLPPHPSCRLCRVPAQQVLIRPEVLQTMKDLTLRTPGIETGGILVGSRQSDGTVLIEEASGPGPNSKCSATGFDRDVAYCQAFVDEKAAAGLLYVGEWHSHPMHDNRPSQTDLTSLANVAQQSNHLTTQPVMVIMSRTGEPSCTVHPSDAAAYVVTLVEQPRISTR